MCNRKILYLVTSSFPYGYGEPFLEKELFYLNQSFDKVIIFTHTKSEIKRNINKDIKVISFRYNLNYFEKIISIFSIFHSKFWKEIKVIKNIYSIRINFGIIKTILFSLSNGKRLRNCYLNNLDNELFNQAYLYSYWLNDSSIAISLMKTKKNQKVFSRMHRWDVYFEESKFSYLPFRHMLYNNLDSIFSISQDAIDYASKHWKINNLDKFKLSRLGVKNNLNLNLENTNIFRIVSCSNLISVKRVDLILESLLLINSFKIEWNIIGDGVLRKQLQKKSLKLPKNITVSSGLIEDV